MDEIWLLVVIVFVFGCIVIFIPKPPCTNRGVVKEFVQAVGHKISTEYIYRNTEGEIFESQNIHQVGEKVCE